MADDSPTTNRSTISVVTITVAILAALCVSTICWMSNNRVEIPPELNTLTGTLCGYLTGVLSKTEPTETTKQAIQIPSQVHVTNKPDDPVPTTTEEKV